MEGNHPYRIPGHGGVIDYATRYLCRQGHTWVVVMESPRVSGALRLRHSGGDTFDARFELLSAARRACPDASILTIDGALDWADYEWRLDVRAVVTSSGDLGSALHRELSRQPAAPPRAPARRAPRLAPVPLGDSAQASGRPLSF